jgi:hypothetical protein
MAQFKPQMHKKTATGTECPGGFAKQRHGTAKLAARVPLHMLSIMT